jgi:hypothetical protein
MFVITTLCFFCGWSIVMANMIEHESFQRDEAAQISDGWRSEKKADPSNGMVKTDVRHLLLYHISKTGGSTILSLFSAVGKSGTFGIKKNGDLSVLTRKGQAMWEDRANSSFIPHMENRCHPKICGCSMNPNGQTCKDPKSLFLIGTVRNPFEYYMSLWLMFRSGFISSTNKNLLKTDSCIGQRPPSPPTNSSVHFRFFYHARFMPPPPLLEKKTKQNKNKLSTT